ncbi:MAG: nuclease-related domain-containing protein [Patescibacteria group bacterium]|jgi:hypothetical protein
MKIQNNYLTKNILLGFGVLVVINILLFYMTGLGKKSFLLWLLAVLPLLWLFSKIKLRTDKFNRGLVSENEIDDVLKQLSEEYVYLSEGLNTARGNIDKIVVGPTGVWALEVKSHSGQFTFDGEHLLRNGSLMGKDFLGQAYAEAKTLQEIINSKVGLNIPVQPVLVFSNKWARVRLGLKQYKGVYIVQKAWLTKLLNETKYQHLSDDTKLKISSYLTHQ